MIDHVWTVLCQSACVDAESGSVSLFNAIETITLHATATFPVRIPAHFEIFTLWARAREDVPSRGKMRARFIDPSGAQTGQVEAPVDLSTALFHRTRIKVDGLNIQSAGRYTLSIELDSEESGVWIPVTLVPVWIQVRPPVA